ncbi:hypothetical protein Q1695_000875 [Nippostrongylus brasiliensis]|nr:hypothetical protein Q1695_000875 [Nippostrongylus brasiliensis]
MTIAKQRSEWKSCIRFISARTVKLGHLSIKVCQTRLAMDFILVFSAISWVFLKSVFSHGRRKITGCFYSFATAEGLTRPPLLLLAMCSHPMGATTLWRSISLDLHTSTHSTLNSGNRR